MSALPAETSFSKSHRVGHLTLESSTMTTPDSPKTPKADYAVMEPGKKMNTQRSLPILATNGKQHSQDMWEPSSARSNDYVNDLQSVPPTSKESCLPSPLRKLARSWMVLRWQLARNLFSVPLPFLTSMFDVKLGDLFITLPICVIFIITTAIQAKDREVESSGNPPTYGLLIVFILTVRNNSALLALTGISYERVLFYHKIAAWSRSFCRVCMVSLMHGASTALIGVIPWGIDMAFRHAYRPRVYARGSMLGGKKSTSEDTPNVSSMGALHATRSHLGATRPDAHTTGRRDHQRYLAGSRSVGGSGTIATLGLLLVFFFAIRNNVLLLELTGISFERALFYHKLFAYTTIVLSALHGLAYLLAHHHGDEQDKDSKVTTGTITLGTSLKKKENTNMGVIASDHVSVAALAGNISRVSFPRVRRDTGEVFKFQAGQYAFLCIPSISKLQWHPFIISSAPHEDIVSFYIKASGDWTNTVFEAASNNDGTQFDILVDGPYGHVSIDLENPETYSHFALFAGGIGITPMRSILNWLHYEHSTLGRSEIKTVRFAWAIPNLDAVKALIDSIVPNGEERAVPVGYFSREIYRDDASSAFHSDFYVTGDVEDPVDQQLGHCLHYGSRFDRIAILRGLGEQAKRDGKDRVAVLVCGPMPMFVTKYDTGHRHFWSYAILWADNPNPDNSTILGESMSGSRGYVKEASLKAKYIANGTTVKSDSYVGFWIGVQAPRLTKKSGKTQDPITWEQLTDEARDAISEFDFESEPSSKAEVRAPFDNLSSAWKMLSETTLSQFQHRAKYLGSWKQWCHFSRQLGWSREMTRPGPSSNKKFGYFDVYCWNAGGIKRLEASHSVLSNSSLQAFGGATDGTSALAWRHHQISQCCCNESNDCHLHRSERDIEAADSDRHLQSSFDYDGHPDIMSTLRTIGEEATQYGEKRVVVPF
ncbi:Riboflavin synthase-like beta-barrel [Phytophthora cactorum]|nr:Riboflavin synthase-like beta-barrel [Phytophthora cactorum]